MVAVMYLSQHQVSKLFMFPVLFPIALYNHFYDQSFTQVEIIGQLHHYLSEDGKLFQRIELVDISLQEPPPCISHYQVPISSFTLYITIHIRISIYHRYHYHQLHYQLHYHHHCYHRYHHHPIIGGTSWSLTSLPTERTWSAIVSDSTGKYWAAAQQYGYIFTSSSG